VKLFHIFIAGGPPEGQPLYRMAPLFVVETRPPRHRQIQVYNCQILKFKFAE
jgi:hypothetical protein